MVEDWRSHSWTDDVLKWCDKHMTKRDRIECRKFIIPTMEPQRSRDSENKEWTTLIVTMDVVESLLEDSLEQLRASQQVWVSASTCRRLSPSHLVPPSSHRGSRAALHNNISSSNHLAHRSNDTWLVYHAVCPFTAHVSNAYLLKTHARTPVRYLMLPAMQNISSHSRTSKTSHIATFIPQVIFPFCRSFPPSFKYWIFTVASLRTPLSNLINKWLLHEILSVLPAHSLCIKLSTVLTQPMVSMT